MAKKKSEKKEGFWGNKYTQHYDEDGNKDGYSEEKEGFWGDKYTQHYDKDGEKTGYTEDKEGFWGDKYRDHRDMDGNRQGYSEKKEGFWGNKYTRHNDKDGNEIGRSEIKEDFWGNKYTEYNGKKTSYGYDQPKRSYNSTSSSAGDDFGLVGLGLGIALFLAVVYLIIIALVIALTIIVLGSPIGLFIYHFVSKSKSQWMLWLSAAIASYLMVDFGEYIFASRFLDENLNLGTEAMMIFQYSYALIAAIPIYFIVESWLAKKYPYQTVGKFLEKKYQRRGTIMAGISLVFALFLGLSNMDWSKSSGPTAVRGSVGNTYNGNSQSYTPPATSSNAAPSTPAKDRKVMASRQMTEGDLHGFSRSQLRILRNEVFAKYGYAFQTQDMKQHFGRVSWYRNLGKNNESVLLMMTAMEKDNVKMIKSYEESFKEDKKMTANINDPDGYTNIRSEKNADSKILGQVQMYETFDAYPTDQSNWWLVEYQGIRGYMHNSRVVKEGSVTNHSHNNQGTVNHSSGGSAYSTSSSGFYVINIEAHKSASVAREKANDLNLMGYPSGYLWIPDYQSLSGAEYHTVYIGPYYTQIECALAVDNVRKKFPNAYGTLVSQENRRVEIRGNGKVKETYY